VDDHPGRFVDRKDVVIFIEDFERDGLWSQGRAWDSLEANFHLIAFFGANPLFDTLSIEQNAPLLNQVLKIGPGIRGKPLGEEFIDPYPLFFKRDEKGAGIIKCKRPIHRIGPNCTLKETLEQD
jgi:hypothetical protein